MAQALNSAAPAGFRSPQLAALVNQLPWISVAGKPDGDVLRVVAEGETSSDAISSQLREFLEGIQLLAVDGLNDSRLRRELNPEERSAYLELLASADIQKLDRGDTKSVRVILSVTPRLLDVAANFNRAAIGAADPAPPKNTGKNSQPRKLQPPRK